MIGPLRSVLVRRPDQAFGNAQPDAWHYSARPDLRNAQHEHDKLVELLRASNVEVVYHKTPLPDKADAIYPFDPAIVTDRGAVVLRMGKPLRRGEEKALAGSLAAHGVPILATLADDATAEGGDLLWIDNQTIAVGIGFRTNAEGCRQLNAILGKIGIETLPVELPYHTGPESCLHLLSLISIVDRDLAVVYAPLLSVPFWTYLEKRGFRFIEVPEREFATMGTNVLAISPGKCIMLEGNPATQRRLEEAGCEVMTYRGNDLSLKSEGGPTCLTRPILRAY